MGRADDGRFRELHRRPPQCRNGRPAFSRQRRHWFCRPHHRRPPGNLAASQQTLWGLVAPAILRADLGRTEPCRAERSPQGARGAGAVRWSAAQRLGPPRRAALPYLTSISRMSPALLEFRLGDGEPPAYGPHKPSHRVIGPFVPYLRERVMAMILSGPNRPPAVAGAARARLSGRLYRGHRSAAATPPGGAHPLKSPHQRANSSIPAFRHSPRQSSSSPKSKACWQRLPARFNWDQDVKFSGDLLPTPAWDRGIRDRHGLAVAGRRFTPSQDSCDDAAAAKQRLTVHRPKQGVCVMCDH